MDTICGLDAEECHYQQDYVSSLVQTVKNNINRVSYIECDTDPEVELALTESKYNNVPENPPNDDALLEIFQMIKDSDTCELNAINDRSSNAQKRMCLDEAIAQFNLTDYTRSKKVVYVSNCEEASNINVNDSICARDDLQSIGGRIDVIAINVQTSTNNKINRYELECITGRDKIFAYTDPNALDDMNQFEKVWKEICEPPTAFPTYSPTPEPTPPPTRSPSLAPTAGPSPFPSPAPTNSPNYQPKCVWEQESDVIFVVDEACGIKKDDMVLQNEFIANMIQKIKIDSKNPRVGYVGCHEVIDEVIPLDHIQYNALVPIFPVGPQQVNKMSQIIRDRNNFNFAAPPPRSECILNAMDQMVPNDGRNKKIVLVSNCVADNQFNPCALVETELRTYSDHIDFIFVNVDKAPRDTNTCLDKSADRLFYFESFSDLEAHQDQAEELTDEICDDPSNSPTPAPTDAPTPEPSPSPTFASYCAFKNVPENSEPL